MANSKLSFSIAVKLLTENFKSGATAVKSQLRSMQMQAMSFVAALGAGTIGLGNFISKLVETAKETSRVNIALKNVSGSAEEYLSNQRWLVDISKKYGVNINALTNGYAKFKAAADISNMSLVDQRKIFESVSRASVAFALNAEDQNGVFLAMSQMMGKGKISSEELRLQMGERLPIAIQAMAKAAGVSVGELEKLMKQGKVLSADVLPRFADALNEMIPNVDTNNLSKSLSDLGNTFIEFTKNMNVEGVFKTLVETATSLLTTLSNNTKLIFAGIKAAIYYSVGSVVWGWLKSCGDKYNATISSAVKAMDSLTGKSTKVAQAQRALDEASVKYNAALEAEKVAIVSGSEEQKQAARLSAHNAEIALNKRSTALVRAQEAQKQAAATITGSVAATAAKKGATGWAWFGNRAAFAIKGIGTALKSLAASTLLTGIITGAIWLLSELIGKIREAIRVSNIVKDAIKKAEEPTINGNITQVAAYQSILNNVKSTEEERRGALSEINKLLGTQYEYGKLFAGELGTQKKALDDLNGKIADQIKLLSLRDRAVKYQTAADEANSEIDRIQKAPEFIKKQHEFNNLKEAGVSVHGDRAKTADNAAKFYKANPDKIFAEWLAEYHTNSANKEQKRVAEIKQSSYSTEELDQQKRVSELASGQLININYQISKIVGANPEKLNQLDLPPIGDPKDKKTELQKQEEEYAQSLEKLKAQRGLGLITGKEYNNAERELVEQMYVKAKSSGDDVIPKNSDYFKTLQTEYDKSNHGEALKAEQDYAEILKQYNDEVKEQTRLLDAGYITYEDYKEKLFDLAQELKKQLVSKDLTKQGNLIYRLNHDAKQNAPSAPVKTYDNSRDYKKNDIEILSGQLDVAKENAEKIRALYEKNASIYTNQLNQAMGNVNSLEDALKIAEAQEAVKNLSKEIRSGLYEGTKNIVSNIDGIVSSFERVGDVLTDSDASAWEKMMAVWQAMVSIGDAISETADFIEKLSMAKELLAKAEESGAAASTAATTTNAANAAANMATDATETSSQVANAGVKIGAAQGAAMAKSAESTAGIPFPWNLVAMATVMAGVTALFATIPKFEKGGIVGGNSKTGDKILARINSGELILNQDQQGTLYGLLNSGAPKNIHITGEFRMRGRDMLAAIDKNTRIKQRVG